MKFASLRKKLILLGVTISILIPIISGVVAYVDRLAFRDFTKISSEVLPQTEILGEALYRFRQIRIPVRSIPLRGNDQETIGKFIAETLTAVQGFEELLVRIEKLTLSAQARVEFGNLLVAWKDFRAFGVEIIDMSKAGDSNQLAEAARQIRDICPLKTAPVEKAMQAMISIGISESTALVLSANHKKDNANQVLIWASIFGLLFGSFLSGLLANRISEELRSIASTLNQEAGEVGQTSVHLQAASVALSSSTSEQAAAIQETAAAIEQIKSMVNQSTDSASQGEKLSGQSKENATDGVRVMGDMLSAMDRILKANDHIEQEVRDSNEKIGGIVSMIQEIEGKTKIINDIVFQTKLLSFNASVEAARAGEHGKGFAVVAEEVGNLAQMSGGASREIADLLQKSTDRVQQIVSETQSKVNRLIVDSKDSVKKGVSIAKNCEMVLQKIVESSSSVAEVTTSISAANQEQSHGIVEISKAIQELESTTQVNASTAERTSASASDLAPQVESMKLAANRLKAVVEGSNAPGSKAGVVNPKEKTNLFRENQKPEGRHAA